MLAIPVRAFAVLVGSTTVTATFDWVVVLLPSAPLLLVPQQRAVPSVITAHVWAAPTEMLAIPVRAFAVSVGSTTFTGTDESVVALLPS